MPVLQSSREGLMVYSFFFLPFWTPVDVVNSPLVSGVPEPLFQTSLIFTVSSSSGKVSPGDLSMYSFFIYSACYLSHPLCFWFFILQLLYFNNISMWIFKIIVWFCFMLLVFSLISLYSSPSFSDGFAF